tara:strand:+ start:140 stop:262 length:123 start_codon:yes stop_codon:yes gene_type:complete
MFNPPLSLRVTPIPSGLYREVIFSHKKATAFAVAFPIELN